MPVGKGKGGIPECEKKEEGLEGEGGGEEAGKRGKETPYRTQGYQP